MDFEFLFRPVPYLGSWIGPKLHNFMFGLRDKTKDHDGMSSKEREIKLNTKKNEKN